MYNITSVVRETVWKLEKVRREFLTRYLSTKALLSLFEIIENQQSS